MKASEYSKINTGIFGIIVLQKDAIAEDIKIAPSLQFHSDVCLWVTLLTSKQLRSIGGCTEVTKQYSTGNVQFIID